MCFAKMVSARTILVASHTSVGFFSLVDRLFCDKSETHQYHASLRGNTNILAFQPDKLSAGCS